VAWVRKGFRHKSEQMCGCGIFPCEDIRKDSYSIPEVDLLPETIRVVMISEAAPVDPNDNYYCKGDPLFKQTTVQALATVTE